MYTEQTRHPNHSLCICLLSIVIGSQRADVCEEYHGLPIDFRQEGNAIVGEDDVFGEQIMVFEER